MSPEEIAVWIAAILGLILGSYMGYRAAICGRHAREEAIRRLAYAQGRESVFRDRLGGQHLIADMMDYWTSLDGKKETK
jgi:hypothetical protein